MVVARPIPAPWAWGCRDVPRRYHARPLGAHRASFSFLATTPEVSLKDVILTPEGYDTLKQELDTLRTDRRREIAERIRTAREFGDIAENAEYDDAKNEQAMLEHKDRPAGGAARARARDRHRRGRHERRLDGSVVRLRDVDAKETLEYHIVGSAEANPVERKLSNESPVGKAIMGHKKGETVEVTTPRGSVVKFKIMEIKAMTTTGRRPRAAGSAPLAPRATPRAARRSGLKSLRGLWPSTIPPARHAGCPGGGQAACRGLAPC